MTSFQSDKRRTARRAALLLLMLFPVGAIAAPREPAVKSADDLVLVTTNRLADLQQENEALHRENELLSQENKVLRKEIAKRNQTIEKNRHAKAPAPKEETAESKREEYWLSPSGKRHNSRCRYFQLGNGKPCQKDDGVPCKICGG